MKMKKPKKTNKKGSNVVPIGRGADLKNYHECVDNFLYYDYLAQEEELVNGNLELAHEHSIKAVYYGGESIKLAEKLGLIGKLVETVNKSAILGKIE